VRELLLATRSAGKLRELTPLLHALGFHVLTLTDADIPESPEEEALEAFDTFEANALAKAQWFARISDGRPVVSDDSGLAVDALGGRPGVRSKRWSGRAELEGKDLDEANNAFLQLALRESGQPAPYLARYVCAAACVWNAGAVTARGETEGVIIPTSRGSGGFGYDPYFLSADLGQTFAESSREEKERVSHRGRAFRELVRLLRGDPAFPAAVDH
jgi:XTP/dITP diphosphohydrolase